MLRRSIQQIRNDLRNIGSDKEYVKFCLGDAFGLNNSIGIINFSNPKARNAMNGKMMSELSEVIDTLTAMNPNDDTTKQEFSLKSIVLYGQNNYFCAGADIAVARKELGTTKGGYQMSTLMIDSLTRLRQLPFITIAAIEGAAIGGGAELATACDFRILNSDAYIRFVQSKMGITPGWGGATRLMELVGRRNALRLLGTAQVSNATDSIASGLVDGISPADQSILQTVETFVEPYLHTNAQVLARTKEIIAFADEHSYSESIENEQKAFLSLWGGPVNQEALRKTRK